MSWIVWPWRGHPDGVLAIVGLGGLVVLQLDGLIGVHGSGPAPAEHLNLQPSHHHHRSSSVSVCGLSGASIMRGYQCPPPVGRMPAHAEAVCDGGVTVR